MSVCGKGTRRFTCICFFQLFHYKSVTYRGVGGKGTTESYFSIGVVCIFDFVRTFYHLLIHRALWGRLFTPQRPHPNEIGGGAVNDISTFS